MNTARLLHIEHAYNLRQIIQDLQDYSANKILLIL